MAERTRRLAAILPLLLAVLSAGLAPHLHGPQLQADASRRVSAASQDGPPALRGVEAGDCVMCRSGQSSRLAIAGHARLDPVAPAAGSLPLFGDGPCIARARLVRNASAPRAPPV